MNIGRKHMKKMRRFIGVMMACILACCGLVGCSTSKNGEIIVNKKQEEEGENVKLTFFGFKADALNLTAIETALHQFMDDNETIEVKYEGIKGSAYWESFEKRLEVGEMDDIMMVDHDHVISMNADGKLADLSDLPTIDSFNEMTKGQFVNEDGSVYFLPTCISTYGLYINYDLLKKHGQEIPKNLKEFTQVCDYFAEQKITPMIGNNYSSLRSLIVAKGLYEVYQKENPMEEVKKFNNWAADLAEQLRSGIELVEMMIEHGWFDSKEVLETAQTSDDLAIFAKGERPFMVTGGWASPRVMAMEPGFEYGIYPFPILEDGSVLVMDANTCIGVNADSGHLKEAKDFVSFLTDADVLWEYCDSQSSFTPLADSRMPKDETIAPSAEYLTNGRSVIGSDYNFTLPLDNSLMECARQMLNGMNAADTVNLLSDLLAGKDAK